MDYTSKCLQNILKRVSGDSVKDAETQLNIYGIKIKDDKDKFLDMKDVLKQLEQKIQGA